MRSPMVLQRLLDQIKDDDSTLIPTYQTNAWLADYYTRELGLSDILSTSKNKELYDKKVKAATEVVSKISFEKCFVHYELLKRAMKYAVYRITMDQIKECKEYYERNPSHRATDEGLDSLVVSRHSSQNSFSCL
jgi:hypothetical protein